MYDKHQCDKAKQHLLIAKHSPVKYSADEYKKTHIESLIRKAEQKLAK